MVDFQGFWTKSSRNVDFCNFCTFCKGWNLAPFYPPGTLLAATPLFRVYRHEFRRGKRPDRKIFPRREEKRFGKNMFFENFKNRFLKKSRIFSENRDFRRKIEISILVENRNENHENRHISLADFERV